jgi:malate dehydrogenase (oxaloacetate-decarboxylating)
MPSAGSYSITIRAEIPAKVGVFGRVMAAIGEVGAEVGGVDIVRSTRDAVIRDITVFPRDEAHGEEIRRAIAKRKGVRVISMSDRVIHAHMGGKIGMQSRTPLETRDDLSMAYTPGVARVCMAIHHDPEAAWDYTIKGNSVMVVSDGSNVVGRGDLGALASLPAAEAKCMFLREFAGVDGFPLPVTVRDPATLTRIVKKISSVFAGIHLSDIAAPRCFEILEKLGAEVDIPVFQDDQEGTAAAVLGGVLNGLRLAGKCLEDSSVVVAGLGPGGTATVRLLVAAGAGEVIACDSDGAVHAKRRGMDERLTRIAATTNPGGRTGPTRKMLKGADIFVGLSEPDLLTAKDVKTMAKSPVVFALAMPRPEISARDAVAAGAVYGSVRPDTPNQISSALAYPGIWRGAIDVRATRINDAMVMAAARAIASGVPADALSPDFVVPSVLDKGLAPAIAKAVREAAWATGVARVTAALA